MARVEFKGREVLNRNLRRLGDRAPMVVGSFLREEGEKIMAESKGLVPVDTGALRASGNVQGPSLEGGNPVVTLSYGGASAPYAIFVHENLTARHNPPTQAKFLEEPFKRAAKGLVGRLAIRTRRAIEGLARR